MKKELESESSKNKKRKNIKKIAKLEQKKAKNNLKIADEIQITNSKEIELTRSLLNKTKQESSAIVEDSYMYKQAGEYEKAAEELLENVAKLRVEADKESNTFKKSQLLQEAASAEITAIKTMYKAKKLYSEAIVESPLDIVNDTNTSESILKQSTGLLEESSNNIALAQSKKQEAKKANKKERNNLLFEAEKLEKLAVNQKEMASKLEDRAVRVKQLEDALVENQITDISELNKDEITKVKQSPEYLEYHNNQSEISGLSKQIIIKNNEITSFNNLSKQQESKAKTLRIEANNTEDVKEREKLIESAIVLEQSAEDNKTRIEILKQETTAIVQEVKQKKMAQAEVINSISPDLAENFEKVFKSNTNSNPNENKVLINENASSELESVNNEVIVKSNFLAPEIIEKSIFVIDSNISYSKENPIPVNPTNPKGLVYKVQVGAFRRPIPQDLFSGFAPISAEKIRDDITRYRVGYFKSFISANVSKNEIRKLGYSDAFVVATYNGERITLAKAKELISSNSEIAANTIESSSSDNNIQNPNINSQNNTVEENESNTTALTNTVEENESNTTTLNNTTNEIESDFNEDVAEITAINKIEGVIYSVQVGAFSKPIKKDDDYNISPLVMQRVNNLYKYSTGIFPSISVANQRKEEIKQKGISDAFIVAYYNGSRITIAKSLEIIDNTITQTNNIPEEEENIEVIREFHIDLGTFKDSVPQSISGAMFKSEYRIIPRTNNEGRQYISDKISSIEETFQAKEYFSNLGISNLQALLFSDSSEYIVNISGNPKKVDELNFRVYLGIYYEELPQKLSDVFMRLDYLDIEKKDDADASASIYYASNKDLYKQTKDVLKAFVDEGVLVSKIVAIYKGKEIDLDIAKLMTGEF